MTRLRLGLFLSAQHPPGVRPADALRDHLEQVALVRDLGFESLWAGQHFLSQPFQMFQTVPLLARVAAEAGGMTLGPGILLLTLLNPIEVAENAATLDAITDGRFVLGVGLGYRATENAAFGVGKGRGDLFERKLAVVRRLLAGESVTAAGEGFALEDASLALLPERPPPVWIAANSDKAVTRAARLGDAGCSTRTPRSPSSNARSRCSTVSARRWGCRGPNRPRSSRRSASRRATRPRWTPRART